MAQRKSAVVVALILAFAGASFPAQKQNVEESWRELNARLARSYEQKDWTASLGVLEQMMTLAKETKNGEARAAVLSMRGCLLHSAPARRLSAPIVS